MSSYITTYTRKQFDPLDPKPEDLNMEDIAHALSLLCRGNGHVTTFWSVGQHCICCAKEAEGRGLSERIILACLLHDASECYMSDVPRPFKQTMTEYIRQEEKLLSVIYTKFLGSDLTEEEQEQVKKIDDDLLWYDLVHLLDMTPERTAPKLHTAINYTVQPFENVEQEYLGLYRKHREMSGRQ